MNKLLWTISVIGAFIVGAASVYTYNSYSVSKSTNGSVTISKKVASAQSKDAASSQTLVSYDGYKFSPDKVTIQTGNHIIIVNKSNKNLLWLDSTESALSTVRGYGQSEALQKVLTNKGTFLVTNKLNQNAKLEVTVE